MYERVRTPHIRNMRLHPSLREWGWRWSFCSHVCPFPPQRLGRTTLVAASPEAGNDNLKYHHTRTRKYRIGAPENTVESQTIAVKKETSYHRLQQIVA